MEAGHLSPLTDSNVSPGSNYELLDDEYPIEVHPRFRHSEFLLWVSLRPPATEVNHKLWTCVHSTIIWAYVGNQRDEARCIITNWTNLRSNITAIRSYFQWHRCSLVIEERKDLEASNDYLKELERLNRENQTGGWTPTQYSLESWMVPSS